MGDNVWLNEYQGENMNFGETYPTSGRSNEESISARGVPLFITSVEVVSHHLHELILIGLQII